MHESTLVGKKILAVDEKPDVLAVLEKRFWRNVRIASLKQPPPIMKPSRR